MVYVDWLMNHGWRLYSKVVKSCHLYADSKKELIAFAKELGLKKRWIQRSRKGVLHYDLTESKRDQAIRLGAHVISSPKEWLDIQKRLQEGITLRRQ